MDLQLIKEKSSVLTEYITKYQTKAEKSSNVDVFEDINSNKSLQSRLWNIALRSLNSRECGALEAADTLLGIPLYGKDRNTVIKYVNVYRNRQRKVKSYKKVQELDENSTSIFEASLVDDQYPARPKELENVCLYDFVKCYDVVKDAKTTSETYKFVYGYVKKRKMECLVSHKIHNVKQNPENYFYSLLLLFKPWRDPDDLKGQQETYTAAFDACKNELVSAMEHHEKLQEISAGRDEVETLVSDLAQNLKSDADQEKNCEAEQVDKIEAAGAMAEFRDALANEKEDLAVLADAMNIDQRRVFDHVTGKLREREGVLRHFVSGVGGTGKSFLIRVLKLWVRETLHKEVAVCAPTGIAAFNINGLTLHRLLQLPIEHGSVQGYKSLNDDVLQILRTDLKDVVLLIIDEVSMVSNITLMYIHLRLSEIFNTVLEDDGWFGRIHILLFGDLLQLPPVMQHAPFIGLTKAEVDKYLSCLHATNIWQDLFSYDELTINMRQKDDKKFVDLLSRIRLGIVSEEDMQVLSEKRINFQGESRDEKLDELCRYMQQLPEQTICLLPTKAQTEDINRKMLELIPGTVVELVAVDDIEGDKFLKNRALKKLTSYEEDNSRTAGLDKKIAVKRGAKIMLRRNIDVTLGLVNGAIGTITNFIKDASGRVTAIDVQFPKEKHRIEPVVSKFEVLSKVYVYRKQFPLSLAYGITIHKSQGLSLTSCLIDIGNSTFTHGQSYVALSRVTSLEGLHIINFDPKSVSAHDKSIQEYNRLRMKYRPDLNVMKVAFSKKLKAKDQVWYTLRKLPLAEMQKEQDVASAVPDTRLPPGYTNDEGVSCYANAICQCIFSFDCVLSSIDAGSCTSQALKILSKKHAQGYGLMDTTDLRKEVGLPFTRNQQQDVEEFLTALTSRSDFLNALTTNITLLTKKCRNPSCGYSTANRDTTNFVRLYTGQESKPVHIKKLVEDCSRWQCLSEETLCVECSGSCSLRSEIEVPAQIVVCQIMMWDEKGSRKNVSINGVPNTTLKFGNQSYKIEAAVFHHGEGVTKGHYTAMRRNKNKWILMDDRRVTEGNTWPRSSRNAYLLFYRNIETAAV